MDNATFALIMFLAYSPIFVLLAWQFLKTRADQRRWEMDSLKQDFDWKLTLLKQDIGWKLSDEIQKLNREMQRRVDPEFGRRVASLESGLAQAHREIPDLRHRLEGGQPPSAA